MASVKLLEPTGVYCGDARHLDRIVAKESVALAVWSPPYHVGKAYERDVSFLEWKALLRRTLQAHAVVLKPGGFVAVNIADILCFSDPNMPRVMAENVSRRSRSDITQERILQVMQVHPRASRYEIASILGCSEQTVDRRLHGNNIRGGKYITQTRVKLVGEILEESAHAAGLYLYDRRIWQKDPAWENSRWHTVSYRAIDEFEYIYVFWKPGQTVVDRTRLSRDEWTSWGSRGVWKIPSVRANDDHEAKFPIELPKRIIRLLTDPGDVVVDPFVGSGSSGVAAVLTGRKFIGIDIVPAYVDMARRALERASKAGGATQLQLTGGNSADAVG